MSILEVSFYSAGIVILVASIYTFKLDYANNLFRKLVIHNSVLLDPQNQKPESQYDRVVASSRDLNPKYPSSWWTDEEQFQLERRALFSKQWLFITHNSRFQRPGDYRTFEIAGFSIIIILGKDTKLRAFHNVCRHRAYAVTKKEYGSSTVLHCRYHGWSYDTKGNLIKAPEFEKVEGFDKSMNGLWELKTEVQEGMVFVNFAASVNDIGRNISESESIMRSWKVREMKWAYGWRLEGAFNWKLAGHFFPNVLRETSASKWALPGILRTKYRCVVLSNTTLLQLLTSGGLLILRALPLSPNKTLIECSIYVRGLKSTRTTYLEFQSTRKEVESEVKRLELQQEALLNGSEYCQRRVDEDELHEKMRQHSLAEEEIGRKIYPAAQKQSFTQEGMADDDLCKELESNVGGAVCSATAKGLLDW